MSTFLRWGFAMPAGVVALLAFLASAAGVADWSIGLVVAMACAVSADAALHLAALQRNRAERRAAEQVATELSQRRFENLERIAGEQRRMERAA